MNADERQNRVHGVKRRVVLLAVLLAVGLFSGWMMLKRPSNHRRWVVGQQVMPTADFGANSVTIRGLRNFSYARDGTAFPHYEARTYDLNKLRTAWFVLAPFESDNRGPAHTFLSFGFADSQFVAISVEARREVGEDYSIVKGLLRNYEIMYVIGDERDLVGMRANIRHDDVYVYPIRTSPEKVRRLFVQMLERANQLREHPEFYNTLTNNCTTNILQHANSVASRKIPYGKEVLLPGYADELAERLGLLDTNLPIDSARIRFRVNERAARYALDPDFSVKIRNPD